MNNYKVLVLQDTMESKANIYLVRAGSEEDAMQIAFALDGGWGKDRNATGMLTLARMYCKVLGDSK